MAGNQHHTEYAPPVLRAPSPASSIGTSYGEDQTSLSDREDQLSQEAFERKVEERLALGNALDAEIRADQNPLLVRPPSGSDEEDALYKQVVENLRKTVRDLEEDDVFERTVLRGSQVGLEPLPSSNDIDVLMRSMMVAPTSTASVAGNSEDRRGRTVSRKGGFANGFGIVNGLETPTDGSLVEPSSLTPGKRSRNGSRRN